MAEFNHAQPCKREVFGGGRKGIRHEGSPWKSGFCGWANYAALLLRKITFKKVTDKPLFLKSIFVKVSNTLWEWKHPK
jgi:hypothetical protein